jgi:hypothetical protein
VAHADILQQVEERPDGGEQILGDHERPERSLCRTSAARPSPQ